MKDLLLFLLLVLSLAACDKEEIVPREPSPPQEPVPEEPVAPVDSFHLDLVTLDTTWARAGFVIRDFTARVPGVIWGTTYREERGEVVEGLFSFDVGTEQLNFIPAPRDLGLPHYMQITAGTNGKLYIHSTGIVSDRVAVYDLAAQAWSTIQLPGYVSGTTYDDFDKMLWIAHKEGVSTYQDGTLYTYDDTNSPLRRIVSGSNNSFLGGAPTVDREGNVWYANQGDLYLHIKGEWSEHPLSPIPGSFRISHLVASERTGVLVNAYDEYLSLIDPSAEVKDYQQIPELAEQRKFPLSLLDRSVDESLIYTHLYGFSYYDAARDTVVQVDASNSILPAREMSFQLDRDPEGNIWIGGGNVLGTVPETW